ncbi:MAG: DUF1186 domain-containing protein, partial [Verrucomicrobia bacterium]|nr:DUF1186 domain-containing protein [Verrucomicrobiota bacterium]
MTSIEKYVHQILRFEDNFPEEALMHLIDREEEAKPYLRDILANTFANYKELPEEYVGHIFALYLLAFFRDEQGYSFAIKFLELPEPYPRALFHDLLTQSYPAVIASCYHGNPEPLYTLIQSDRVSYLSKVIALVAISILVNRKTLSRSDFAKFLTQFLEHEKDPALLAVIAQEVSDMHLNELYDPIKALYAAGAIDEKQY